MVNRMKDKGDRAEREALAMLKDVAADLLVENPMRQLGAGRKDDIGDLHVFPDVAVQVKACSDSTIRAACRAAATGATVQASRLLAPVALGLVKVPGARGSAVKWLACVELWPTDLDEDRVTPFGSAVAKAIDHAKSGQASPAHIFGRGADPYLIAPLSVWLDDYRARRTS